MKQTTKRTFKKNTANFFGAIGYLFCFFQWFWAIILYFSIIQYVTSSLTPNADPHIQQLPSIPLAPPGPMAMIIFAIITVLMIAITIYALVKIPMDIAKTTNKAVRTTAVAVVPVVIKAIHKKDTKKNRAAVTAKLMLAIKLVAVVSPIAVTAASGLLEKQAIDYSIAMVTGCGLAGFTAIFFALQYGLASLFRVKLTDLW